MTREAEMAADERIEPHASGRRSGKQPVNAYSDWLVESGAFDAKHTAWPDSIRRLRGEWQKEREVTGQCLL